MIYKTILLAFIMGLAAVSAGNCNICGKDKKFMVALKCKGQPQALLFCADGDLKKRSDFCKNPKCKWSENKCKKYGGLEYVDTANSGCYTEKSPIWGGTLSCCNPLKIPNIDLENLGFENKDTSHWVVSGPTPPTVQCDADAPEGSCYGVISTTGTYTASVENKLSRNSLYVPNLGGCNGAAYKLTFFFKFTSGDYLPYNDYLKIIVKDGLGSVFGSYTLDVATVGDYGTSGWKNGNILLGSVPTGSVLYIDFTASTKNTGDDALTSYGYIDGVKLSVL